MAVDFTLLARLKIEEKIVGLTPAVNRINTALKNIKGTTLDIKIDQKSLRSLDNLDTKLVKLNTTFASLNASAVLFQKTLQGISAPLQSVQSVAANINKSVKQQPSKRARYADDDASEDDNLSFGEQSGRAFRRYAAFAVSTAAVFRFIGAVRESIDSAIAFERELVKIAQVSRTSVKNIQFLADNILNLSRQYGISSNELAKSARTLAQTGRSAQEVGTILTAIAKSDLAPTFDNITTTTEGMIAAMQQFKLTANDVEGVLGSINAVSAEFAVESNDIIAAIKRTGGVFAASSFGKSGQKNLQDFISLFTAVRATTRESSESIATGLRTIFTRIQRPRTLEFLKSLDIQLQDSQDNFVGVFEAIKRLNQAIANDPRLNTAGSPVLSQLLEEIGGTRQIGKSIPLLQQFEQAQKAVTVAQEGSNSITEIQDTALGSLGRQLDRVKQNFNALITEVFNDPSVRRFLTTILDLTDGIINLGRSLRGVLPLLLSLGVGLASKSFFTLGKNFTAGLFGTNPVKRAGGGTVSGGPGIDTIPALLTNGEYVINAQAAKRLGPRLLGQLNSVQKFNTGGPVGMVRPMRFQEGGQATLNKFAGVASGIATATLLSNLINETGNAFGEIQLIGLALTFAFRNMRSEAAQVADAHKNVANASTQMATKLSAFANQVASTSSTVNAAKAGQAANPSIPLLPGPAPIPVLESPAANQQRRQTESEQRRRNNAIGPVISSAQGPTKNLLDRAIQDILKIRPDLLDVVQKSTIGVTEGLKGSRGQPVLGTAKRTGVRTGEIQLDASLLSDQNKVTDILIHELQHLTQTVQGTTRAQRELDATLAGADFENKSGRVGPNTERLIRSGRIRDPGQPREFSDRLAELKSRALSLKDRAVSFGGRVASGYTRANQGFERAQLSGLNIVSNIIESIQNIPRKIDSVINTTGFNAYVSAGNAAQNPLETATNIVGRDRVSRLGSIARNAYVSAGNFVQNPLDTIRSARSGSQGGILGRIGSTARRAYVSAGNFAQNPLASINSGFSQIGNSIFNRGRRTVGDIGSVIGGNIRTGSLAAEELGGRLSTGNIASGIDRFRSILSRTEQSLTKDNLISILQSGEQKLKDIGSNFATNFSKAVAEFPKRVSSYRSRIDKIGQQIQKQSAGLGQQLPSGPSFGDRVRGVGSRIRDFGSSALNAGRSGLGFGQRGLSAIGRGAKGAFGSASNFIKQDSVKGFLGAAAITGLQGGLFEQALGKNNSQLLGAGTTGAFLGAQLGGPLGAVAGAGVSLLTTSIQQMESLRFQQIADGIKSVNTAIGDINQKDLSREERVTQSEKVLSDFLNNPTKESKKSFGFIDEFATYQAGLVDFFRGGERGRNTSSFTRRNKNISGFAGFRESFGAFALKSLGFRGQRDTRIDKFRGLSQNLDVEGLTKFVSGLFDASKTTEDFEKSIKPLRATLYDLDDIILNSNLEVDDVNLFKGLRKQLESALTVGGKVENPTVAFEILEGEASKLARLFKDIAISASRFDSSIESLSSFASGNLNVQASNFSTPVAFQRFNTASPEEFAGSIRNLQKITGSGFGTQISKIQEIRSGLPNFIEEFLSSDQKKGADEFKEQLFKKFNFDNIGDAEGLFANIRESIEQGVKDLPGDRAPSFDAALAERFLADRNEASDAVFGKFNKQQQEEFLAAIQNITGELNTFAKQAQVASQATIDLVKGRANINSRKLETSKRAAGFNLGLRSDLLGQAQKNKESTIDEFLQLGGAGNIRKTLRLNNAPALIEQKQTELIAAEDNKEVEKATRLRKEISALGNALEVAANDASVLTELEDRLNRARAKANARQASQARFADIAITGSPKQQAQAAQQAQQLQKVLQTPQGLQQFVQGGGDVDQLKQFATTIGGDNFTFGRQSVRGKGLQTQSLESILSEQFLGGGFLSQQEIKDLGLTGTAASQFRGKSLSQLPGLKGQNAFDLLLQQKQVKPGTQEAAVKDILSQRLSKFGVTENEFLNNFQGVTGENAIQFKTAFERLAQADVLKRGNKDQQFEAQFVEKQAQAAFRQALGLEGKDNDVAKLQQDILREQKEMTTAANALVNVQSTKLGELNGTLEKKLGELLDRLRVHFNDIQNNNPNDGLKGGKGNIQDTLGNQQSSIPDNIKIDTSSNVRIDVIGLDQISLEGHIVPIIKEVSESMAWDVAKKINPAIAIPGNVKGIKA